MEFLMTYGWAILVVLITISSLAYFGVLRPGKLLPTSCIFDSGISCDDSYINTSTFSIVLTNGFGKDVTFYTFKLIASSGNSYYGETDKSLSDGDSVAYYLNIVNESSYLNVGSRASFDVEIGYNKEGSPLNKTLNGRIIGLVH